MVPHVRKPTKRTFRTSSSGFVRRGGIAGEIATFCGEPITSYDVTTRDVASMLKHGDPICAACVEKARPQP